MCNKYKYKKACFDCYQILSELEDFDKERLSDSNSKQLALFYLSLAIKKGYNVEMKLRKKDTILEDRFYLNKYYFQISR